MNRWVFSLLLKQFWEGDCPMSKGDGIIKCRRNIGKGSQAVLFCSKFGFQVTSITMVPANQNLAHFTTGTMVNMIVLLLWRCLIYLCYGASFLWLKLYQIYLVEFRNAISQVQASSRKLLLYDNCCR